MKAPYLEDVNQVGNYDVAIVGVPHDCGTTYRPGTVSYTHLTLPTICSV